jgi:hypothetical protein
VTIPDVHTVICFGRCKTVEYEPQLRASARVTAIPTQVAAHPLLDAVIGGTASGRVYVWRG